MEQNYCSLIRILLGSALGIFIKERQVNLSRRWIGFTNPTIVFPAPVVAILQVGVNPESCELWAKWPSSKCAKLSDATCIADITEKENWYAMLLPDMLNVCENILFAIDEKNVWIGSYERLQRRAQKYTEKQGKLLPKEIQRRLLKFARGS